MYTTTRPFSPCSSPASSPTPFIDSSPASSPVDDFTLDLLETPPLSLGDPFAASAKANRPPPLYEKKPLTPPRSPPRTVPVKKARYASWQPDPTPCLPPHEYVAETPEQVEAAVWDKASNQVVDGAYGTIELTGQHLTHIPQIFISDISNVYIPPENLEYANLSTEFFPSHVSTVPTANMTSRTRSFRRTRSAVGRDPTEIQLFLSSNEITELPLQLFSLQNLTVLSIRNNHLTYLPPEIICLRNLRDLNISLNNLKYLPSEIMQMSLNQLTVLPNSSLLKESHDEQPPPSAWAKAEDPSVTISNTKYVLPKVLPLVEIAFRVLMSPSSASPGECLLTEYYDLPLDECPLDSVSAFHITSRKRHFPYPIPSHLRTVLSTCVPDSVDPEEPPTNSSISVEPWSKVTGIGHCRSPRHGDPHGGRVGSGVFVRHAEERFTWHSVIAGITMGGRVPLLWRGCQWGCLDYLDGSNSDGLEQLGMHSVDYDQVSGAEGSGDNEGMEDIVQVIQLLAEGGLDEFDSD